MNGSLKLLYIILFLLSCFVYTQKYHLLIDKKYIYLDIKYILVLFLSISIMFSLFTNNHINDNYVFPLLLFMNVAILLLIDINYKPSYVHCLSMLGIVYLLTIYNYKEFEVNRGILVNPNKQWIYLYIAILSLWFVTMNKKQTSPRSTTACVILILYPLLFPINEYFIHRVVTILGAAAINMYYFKTLE